MIRVAALLAVACFVFGVGGVLGAGGHLFNTAKNAGGAVRSAAAEASCTRTKKVVSVSFSKTRYANVRKHFLRARRDGWPSVFVVNRKGADQRRDRALEGVPTKRGYDRDEVPPAVGRSTWRADVALVPSSENRSHGARLGVKLRRYCDGVRFRYAFY